MKRPVFVSALCVGGWALFIGRFACRGAAVTWRDVLVDSFFGVLLAFGWGAVFEVIRRRRGTGAPRWIAVLESIAVGLSVPVSRCAGAAGAFDRVVGGLDALVLMALPVVVAASYETARAAFGSDRSHPS